MSTAPARSKPSAIAYGMLLAICCTLATAHCDAVAASSFTQDWQAIDGSGTAQGVELSVQPGEAFKQFLASSSNPTITFEASMVKVTLPPCTVRTMHIHRNVDEIHYVLDGTFTASLHLPDSKNSIVTDTVTVGQSFLAPANHVHQFINPSCDKNATFIGFYNKLDAAITNIAPAAYNLNGSPFMAYQDPTNADSLAAAASGYFAFDATCLATCKKSTPPPCPTTTTTPPTTYTPTPSPTKATPPPPSWRRAML